MEQPRLDITDMWRKLNDSMIALVDYVPEDKINWSPRQGLWNFRGILLHTAAARDQWLEYGVEDGVHVESVWTTVRSKPEIQDAFRRTWSRLERFLSNQGQLDREYNTRFDPGMPPEIQRGHWIAYHLLEHDIHHRADIFHYLALLGIETPDVGTP
jgi:uncharacterized damage-inducible protein DinB